jgi:hypothetical protein
VFDAALPEVLAGLPRRRLEAEGAVVVLRHHQFGMFGRAAVNNVKKSDAGDGGGCDQNGINKILLQFRPLST